GRMDWAIGQIDRNKEEINGRMDWAIDRIDRDKEELLEENIRLKNALQEIERENQALEIRIQMLENFTERIRHSVPFRIARKVAGILKRKK
ncbi:MAG: hypothetical protein Q4E13_09830, partial [Clostridia bacterium]|nr:hypothetical protein [Clostridia bacterium]